MGKPDVTQFLAATKKVCIFLGKLISAISNGQISGAFTACLHSGFVLHSWQCALELQ